MQPQLLSIYTGWKDTEEFHRMKVPVTRKSPGLCLSLSHILFLARGVQHCSFVYIANPNPRAISHVNKISHWNQWGSYSTMASSLCVGGQHGLKKIKFQNNTLSHIEGNCSLHCFIVVGCLSCLTYLFVPLVLYWSVEADHYSKLFPFLFIWT